MCEAVNGDSAVLWRARSAPGKWFGPRERTFYRVALRATALKSNLDSPRARRRQWKDAEAAKGVAGQAGFLKGFRTDKGNARPDRVGE